MSAFIRDSVYFVGPVKDIEALWIDYLKAQDDVIREASEHSKQNGRDFTPFIDSVCENRTFYHGSIGVCATKFFVDEAAIILVSTSGDMYGQGFSNGERSESNPILAKLDSKYWKSGNIKRADKTSYNNAEFFYSDENEIFFKKNSFRKIFSPYRMDAINVEWPNLRLNERGFDCLARGGNSFSLSLEEYNSLVEFAKSIPNSEKMPLQNLEEFLNTDFYRRVHKCYQKECKAIRKISASKPQSQRDLGYYEAASFCCNDYISPEFDDYEETLEKNCRVIVKGCAEDLEKFKKAVTGDRYYSHPLFSFDAIAKVYRIKPDYKDFMLANWGCKRDAGPSTLTPIENGLQYDIYLYINSIDEKFPKPIAETLSKMFPNLTIDIQVTFTLHYEDFIQKGDIKEPRWVIEKIFKSAHGEKGIVSYESKVLESEQINRTKRSKSPNQDLPF